MVVKRKKKAPPKKTGNHYCARRLVTRTPEELAVIAAKKRRYDARKRAVEAGKDPDVVAPLDAPLEIRPVAEKAILHNPADLADKDLEAELKKKRPELIAACGKLKEVIPGLELNAAGVIKVNQSNIRKMYQKTWDSIAELEDSDEDLKGAEAWAPPMIVRKHLRAYFKKRPFDKIRLGILRIVDKSGNQIWFEPNDEQEVLLLHVEQTWYNQEPCCAVILKARQIGSSTFWTAVHYCFQTTQSHKTSHVVLEIAEKAEGMVSMLRDFLEGEPEWARPSIYREKPLRLKGNGIKRATIKIESSERRERISRSTTFQFNHLSEIPYWAEPEATFNAMLASMEFAWPLIHVEESTGKNINDVFYNRFHSAMNEKMPGFKAFFFPWFMHKKYSRRLPHGMSERDLRMTLTDEDIAMWDKFSLTKEQIYWYVTRREIEVSSGEKTHDTFKREYPCTPDEAFLGASSNFFDPKQSKSDIYRTRSENRIRGDWGDLKPSVSAYGALTKWAAPIPVMRARLFTDAGNGCLQPRFSRDDSGEWLIWERPRPGHKYIVTGDIARGKAAIKNALNTTDWDVVGVWRYSYEPDEPAQMVQVAQFRGKVGPEEVGEMATAASEIYNTNGERALVVMENNSHGLMAIETARRLGANQYQRMEYGKNKEAIGSVLGFTTTTGGANAQGSKNYLLMRFRGQWNSGKILIMSQITASEMSVFINNDGILEAMSGHHDDTVIDAALAVEGVKFNEGEITLVEVRREIRYDLFLDEAAEELPEEINVELFKRELLRGMGVMMDRSRKQQLKQWM